MKTTFSLIVLVAFLAMNHPSFSQNVAISDNESYVAQSNAMLDVYSTSKGMLVPRVGLVSADAPIAGTKTAGLLVWNTGTTSYPVSGFYYWTGTAWALVGSNVISFQNGLTQTGNIIRLGGALTENTTISQGNNSVVFNLNGSGSFNIQNGVTPALTINNSNCLAIGATSPHASSVFDINSTSKGILIPRLTTAQRISIVNPADGLMVFDITLRSFMYYNSLLSRWTMVSSMPIPDANFNVALFSVQNKNGDTIFAVYPEGVRINVGNGVSKGTKGGFAVASIGAGTKAGGNEYLRVTSDSIRMYIEDDGTKATKGGFAVASIGAGTKGPVSDVLKVNDDSVRIYLTESGVKGTKGGFAVASMGAGTKTGTEEYMQITKENYSIGLGAGEHLSTGLYNSFLGYQTGMQTTTGSNNSFIGYQSGLNNLSGYDNVFIGNQSGKTNSSGNNNILIGIYAGYSLTSGIHNTIIGSSAGYYHTDQSYNVLIGTNAGNHINAAGWSGSFNTMIGINSGYAIQNSRDNTFIGTNAGYWLEHGQGNTFLGIDAGRSGSEHHLGYTANYNTFLGNKAGYCILTGSNNTAVGYYSGFTNTAGSGNVFLGYMAGYSEGGSNKLYIENTSANSSSALIYGEFDANILRLNAKVGIGGNSDAIAALKVTGDAAVTGAISSGSVTSSIFSGNLTGNVTGDLTGKVNNVSVGKIYLDADGTILAIDNGDVALFFDKTNMRIRIINNSHNNCFYWYKTQAGSNSAGNTGVIMGGDSQDLFTILKASPIMGIEIQFGTNIMGAELGSVWLQDVEGVITGHYLK